jgi:hypothetical protein
MSKPAEPSSFTICRSGRRVGCIIVAGKKFVAWSTRARIGAFDTQYEARRAVLVEAIRLRREPRS